MVRDGRWDFYFLRVDDQPASIYLDLSRIDAAPMPHFPVMAYVRIAMRSPREDGLSSQDEFDELVKVEDHLVETLAASGALYVGRNTSAGCRDFYFYIQVDDGRWEQQVAQAMRASSQYRYQADARSDKEWSVYREFLYPSPRALQSIENRSVCDALEGNGDSMSTPREIDHWAYFPDLSSRDAFLQRARELGFQIRARDAGDGGGDEFGAQVFRIDLPSFAAIDDVCLPLYDLAVDCGGRYDGWECQVIQAGMPH